MGRRPKSETTNLDGEATKPVDIVTPKNDSEGSAEPIKSATPLVQRDSAAGVKVKYVSLKIGDDGAFDLSKMKDKSKTELRDAFVKTSRKGELGPAEVADTFSPESMVGYVALLMGFEAQIVVKTMKVDAEVAAQVFSLNPQEQMAIAKPAAKVANKYLADFKYADEMALVGAIVECTFAKIMLCRHMMALRQMENQPKEQKVNGHAAV